MEDRRYRIGIDLGGTNIKVGLVDADYRIVAKRSVKTLATRHYREVVADMAAACLDILATEGLTLADVACLGVGSPGMIDHVNGIVVFAANLGWDRVDLLKALREHIDLPMRLSNDASCAAFGEALAGAAKGCRHVVMLTLGTGLGSGVVVDGRLQEGGSAGGMELGHTTIVVDGEECTCGHRGCIEAYVSATALAKDARREAKNHPSSLLNKLCRGDLSRMNGRIPFEAAAKGDAAAGRVVERYIKYLGEAVINCVNIWRPEKVLIGGGISNEGDPLMVPLNEYVRPRCFAGERGNVPPIVRAELANDAGLIGAAAL